MKPPKKVVIISFHSPRNTGDLAILLRTVSGLKKRLPAIAITVATDDLDAPLPAIEELRDVEFVPSLRRLVGERGGIARAWVLARTLASLIYQMRLRRAWQGNKVSPENSILALAERLATADAILSSGGGYLYGSKRGMVLNWGWLSLLLAVLSGRPVWLLPQSIGPFSGKLQATLTKMLLDRAAAVCVREPLSLEELKKLAPACHYKLVPDLAIGFGQEAGDGSGRMWKPCIPKDSSSQWIGMTALNWSGHTEFFSAQERYETELVQFILRVLENQNRHVFLFAQCQGPLDYEDDRLVVQRVAKMTGDHPRLHVCPPNLDPLTAQDAYGQMDAFIGTRMHSVLMALNACTPAAAIAYLPKSTGIMRMLGMDRFCFPINSVTAGELFAFVNEALVDGHKLRKEVASRVSSLAVAVERTLDEVASGISGIK